MKIIFAGTPEFALPCLEAVLQTQHEVVAVYTQPDRPAGRGRNVHMSPVKTLALDQQLPVYQPRNFKATADVELLQAMAPDLMIVVAYGIILPAAVLAIPKHGCINVHASLLPKWRGAAPIQRAIQHGNQQTGVTIMQLDAGMDTGPMLNTLACDIHADDTAQSLHDRLAQLGAEALLMAIAEIDNGRVQLTAQDKQQASYAPRLSKDEGRIDWQQAAVTIARMVRAFNPWPVAHTELNGELIRIWQAEVIAASPQQAPGTIIKADKQGIDIATKQQVLRIQRLQLPGGKVLAASEILNSRADMFAPGILFNGLNT